MISVIQPFISRNRNSFAIGLGETFAFSYLKYSVFIGYPHART